MSLSSFSSSVSPRVCTVSLPVPPEFPEGATPVPGLCVAHPGILADVPPLSFCDLSP